MRRSIKIEMTTIEKWARSTNYERRMIAAELPIPGVILEKLAKDESCRVRWTVALNPNTPVGALKRLAEDENPSVRRNVVCNAKLPENILGKLAKSDFDEGVRENATERIGSLKILDELSSDESAAIRGAVARNPKAPKKVLARLAKDSSRSIREDVAKIQMFKKRCLKD